MYYHQFHKAFAIQFDLTNFVVKIWISILMILSLFIWIQFTIIYHWYR